jgi:hypothetical protein
MVSPIRKEATWSIWSKSEGNTRLSLVKTLQRADFQVVYSSCLLTVFLWSALNSGGSVVIRRGLKVVGRPVLRRVKSSSLLRSRKEAVSLWDSARRLSLWTRKSLICSRISSITVADRALDMLAITTSRP